MQHIGMPFMHIIIMQPGIIMLIMHSQQAWIIFSAILSPLVQVIIMPMSIMSNLHMPMLMLQVQTIMPFMVMQQEHMPPAIMLQRF